MTKACAAGLRAPVAEPAAMQPIVFDGLRGWLHLPAGEVRDTGVVICSPLGRDARCAHLPMRLLAEQLAASGYPVLRYDHAGLGESADLAPDVDAWPVWGADVQRMAAHLREGAGVRRIVLAGVRLGASLTALRSDAADGLILLAPVLNGRSWVRKLRFSTTTGVHAAAREAEGLDADGLHLSPATVQSLSALDLLQTGTPAGLKVLLASQGRINLPYAARLEQSGAALTQTDFLGYDDLFLDAHSNHPPVDLFAHVIAWMTQSFADMRRGAATASDEAVLTAAPGVLERPACFGAGLRGVLCQPVDAAPDSRAVVFCNTGGDPRAGIGGFAVQAARQLARRGVASLRFDFAGVGDSPGAPGEPRSHVYETSRAADMDAAVAMLQAQGFDRLFVVGVCSGGYHALHAAVRDPRIEGAFVVNPAKLIWREGDSLAIGRRDDGHASRVYMGKARSLETWMRLLRGGVDLKAVARTLLLRLTAKLAQRRDPAAAALRTGVAKLSARGGRACLLVGLDDGSLDEAETYFGPNGARFAAMPGLSLRIEPSLDHGLTRSASRAIVLAALLDWLT
ncbi:MAG: alpha/beta hydrolase [Caulobacteraceae bacterium]